MNSLQHYQQPRPDGYLKYIRVSTTKQEEEGYGPDVQEAGIHSYAARHNLPVIEPAIIDDISGDTFERDGLDKVKALLRAGAAKGVIIYRPDRLARKSWIGLQALEQMHTWDKEVHFENLGLIPNTPEGRFNCAIHFAVGELDKAQTLKKLKAGKHEKIATHKRPLNQGHAPYGYKFVGAKRTSAWEIVEEEAEVIRLIYRLHRDTKSPTGVSDYLTEQRIPTFEDLHPRPARDGNRQLKQRGYGEWNNATIYKILKHPAYKGKMPYYRTYRITDPQTGKRMERIRPLDDPMIVWVDVPAIISEEDWELAQTIIKENDSRGGANRKVEYLLSRRLRCGQCGCKVSGKVFNAYSREYGKRVRPLYYYVCNTANFKQGRRLKICRMPMFRQEWVEATVWDYVQRHLLDPEGLEIGLREMQAMREEERQKLETQLADLQQKVETITAQKQRLISAVIAGIFSPEEVAAQKHQLDTLQQSYTDGIAETEMVLANVGASEEDIQQLKQYAALIRERLDIHNVEHQQHILRLMGLQAEMQIGEDGTKQLAVTSHLAPANVEKVPLISPNLHPS